MTLGERMKGYEALTDQKLLPGVPAIIRLDMRCGHTFCEDLDKPFDKLFSLAMSLATSTVCAEVSGAVLGYTQSDEISIAIRHNVDEREQSQFFGGRINKINSITASLCTLAFNRAFDEFDVDNKHSWWHWAAQFDCRVFNVPNVMELHNYFVWRQRDAQRNSLNALAQSLYTVKELQGKKAHELHDMIIAKGKNWNDQIQWGDLIDIEFGGGGDCKLVNLIGAFRFIAATLEALSEN